MTTLPFEIANLLAGLATWYYYGLMFGRENIPVLQAYGGSFASFLLTGVAASTLFSYALTCFVRSVRVAFASTVTSGASRLNLIDYFKIAGISFRRWLVAKALLDSVPHLLYASAYFIGGILVFGIDLPQSANVSGAILALFLGVTALMGISMIGAGFLLTLGSPYGRDPVTWLVALLANIASGVYFPPEILPEPLRFTSKVLPQTYALKLMRICLLTGGNTGELLLDFAFLTMLTVLLLATGALTLKLGLKLYEKRGLRF